MKCRIALARLAATLLLAAAAVGCNNQPNALELHVDRATKTIGPHDAAKLQVRLTANQDRVCLADGYAFSVEVTRLDGDEVAIPVRAGTDLYPCLDKAAQARALAPVLAPAAVCDVGNTNKRYEVLSAGEERTKEVYVYPSFEDARNFVTAHRSTPRPDLHPAWPPGRYLLRVSLKNKGFDTVWFFPNAIGWKPYDQPIHDDVIVTVADAPRVAHGGK